MILTFLLQFASSFITGWASLTQGIATLPSGVVGSIAYAISAANSLNYLIPTDALFISLGIVVGYEAAIWTFKAAVWIYRHIPFLGH
jgi:hypothetical protein